ncbi:MAG: FecR family protein [Deltaproteobacteria bacterium]|nr:FecR family protein [Deltaproteobacteria bacterium]
MIGVKPCKITLGSLLLCLFLAWSLPVPAQQDRGMGVPAEALPADLSDLDVQDHYIPSNLREVGVLHALNGRVVVVHREEGQAYFGKPGDRIHENDELNTLADSRCRIRFYTDDVVNMAPDTRFAVEAFEDRRGQGEKRSVFSMLKGKAMFYALRLFRYKETRFKVQTPTAVVGVRGTKFGIRVFPLDEKTAGSAGVRVADSGRGFGALLAQATGDGQGSGTEVACGDGTLGVSDRNTGNQLALVNANETYNSATGRKTYDPTNRTLNRIQQDTQVREEGEEEGEPAAPAQPTVQEGDQVTGEETAPQDTSEISANVTDVTSIQTGDQTESRGETSTFTPFVGTEDKPLDGYFSAFLLYRATGNVAEAFTVDPMDSAYAYGVQNSADFIWNYSVDGVDRFEVTLAGLTSNTFSLDGNHNLLGQYSYVQWGYHMADTPPFPVIDGTEYELINKLWFVEGFPSDSTDIAAMSGAYTYSGVVHGTYYSKTDQADLMGSYSTQVDFGASHIKDFHLMASGGGHTIDFTQSGTGSINSAGVFQIDNPDGTFKIDGSAVDYWNVSGAHFGPGAEEQAGSYAAHCPSSNIGAWGVFAGQKQP